MTLCHESLLYCPNLSVRHLGHVATTHVEVLLLSFEFSMLSKKISEMKENDLPRQVGVVGHYARSEKSRLPSHFSLHTQWNWQADDFETKYIVGRKRWRFISPLETPKLYNFNGVFSPSTGPIWRARFRV